MSAAPEHNPEPIAASRRPTLDDLERGVRAGDRAMLGRAITLIESRRADHQEQAQELLLRLLPATGNALRLGITGVPGAGKSTTIEALGTNLTGAGHRVAVLAVDPSSSVSGGSILGDKTRMAKLAADGNAFIRPSPSGCTLGGVARRTRETMLLCEAAGYDVIIVETVGVGQSETVVAEMVDFFLVLMIAGAGDELQGIKRGVLELADMVAVNKADGDNKTAAERAARDYRNALHYMRPHNPHWTARVVTISGLRNRGLDTLWETIQEHRQAMAESGEFDRIRQRQRVRWMWGTIEDQLMQALGRHPEVRHDRAAIEEAVLAGRMTPTHAARKILQKFGIDWNELHEH